MELEQGFSSFKEMMEAQIASHEIVAKEIIDEIKDVHLIIHAHTNSFKEYKNDLMEKYYHIITQGFEYKWFREHPIYFRFTKDGEIHEMQLRHFVTNLLFWSAIVRIDPENLDHTHIIDCTQLSTRYIKKYVDTKIIPYRSEVPSDKLGSIIHDMIYNLSRVSNDFNEILAISMNVEMFIDLANRNPRFKEILYTKVPESMQPHEIEEMLNDLTKEHMDIIVNDEQYNHLKPIMKSSGAIKSGQYREFAVNRGLKPDLSGVTIPSPAQSNYLVGGLNTVSSLYIESLAGRKSLIMNKTVMGSSGHFARLIMLVTSDLKLRDDFEECKTKHPILMHVQTKDHLFKLKNRYYRSPNQIGYKVLQGTETELIGKKILVRSPITCASKEGICRKCYGELFLINRSLNSPGGLSATEISEPVTQNVLSTKHLLATDSEIIKFENEIFDDIFRVFGNAIQLNPEKDNFEGYAIVFIAENIGTLDEIDEETGISKYVPLFHLKTPDGELIEMMESIGKDLYFTPTFTNEIKNFTRGRRKVSPELQKEIITVPLDSLGKDLDIFLVQINNNEKTKPLYDIMDLLDNKKRRAEKGIKDDHEEVAQMMLDLLIQSQIPADSIHGEMIIRSLIRSKEDILEVPNFNKYDAIEDIRLMTIKSALNNHPSITISLSFQYLSKQFDSPLTFRKEAVSYLDPFFKPTIDMEKIINKE